MTEREGVVFLCQHCLSLVFFAFGEQFEHNPMKCKSCGATFHFVGLSSPRFLGSLSIRLDNYEDTGRGDMVADSSALLSSVVELTSSTSPSPIVGELLLPYLRYLLSLYVDAKGEELPKSSFDLFAW